jgi:hypothetical protein
LRASFVRARLHLRVLGQEQARFEVSEPGRHHEIVGRHLEAEPPGVRDECQILLDQRED